MFESAEVGRKLDKAAFAEKAPAVRSALLDAQARLKESDVAAIVVIAGVEGAGKGETVNFLLNWLDVRQVETHAIGLPTEEETERPIPYQFCAGCPRKAKSPSFSAPGIHSPSSTASKATSTTLSLTEPCTESPNSSECW